MFGIFSIFLKFFLRIVQYLLHKNPGINNQFRSYKKMYNYLSVIKEHDDIFSKLFMDCAQK